MSKSTSKSKNTSKSKSPQEIESILRNAKAIMEVEGFVIDEELEDVGRKILTGELNLNDYIEQVKLEAMKHASNEV